MVIIRKYQYVYIYNVPSGTGENIYYYNCEDLLIERDGFQISKNNLKKDKKCAKCGALIHILI